MYTILTIGQVEGTPKRRWVNQNAKIILALQAGIKEFVMNTQWGYMGIRIMKQHQKHEALTAYNGGCGQHKRALPRLLHGTKQAQNVGIRSVIVAAVIL